VIAQDDDSFGHRSETLRPPAGGSRGGVQVWSTVGPLRSGRTARLGVSSDQGLSCTPNPSAEKSAGRTLRTSPAGRWRSSRRITWLTHRAASSCSTARRHRRRAEAARYRRLRYASQSAAVASSASTCAARGRGHHAVRVEKDRRAHCRQGEARTCCSLLRSTSRRP
jgi:hypothetical protein